MREAWFCIGLWYGCFKIGIFRFWVLAEDGGHYNWMMTEMCESAAMRLFIAMGLPTEVRRELARAREILGRRLGPRAMRWTPVNQLHLTLKFLGDVPAARVEALKESVREVCRGHMAMEL